MRPGALGVLAAAMLSACGAPSSSATTPSPAPVSAKAIAAAAGDFGSVALTSCPSPTTGPFAAFAAAYRTDIKFHQSIASIATLVSGSGADNWVSSLAAPDAKPEVCRGSLGYAYTPRSVGKEPVVQSYGFVFKDGTTARTNYAQLKSLLVSNSPQTGAGIGLGPDSAMLDLTDIQRIVWLRGDAVSFLLTQDVDSWQSGAKA